MCISAGGNVAQAEAYAQESLLLARQLQDRDRISHALWDLATIALNQGDDAAAEVYFEEGLLLARQAGHRERIAHLLTNLGGLREDQGDDMQAEAHFQEALTLAQQSGISDVIGNVLDVWGEVQFKQQRFEQASLTLREALKHVPEGNLAWTGNIHFHLARTAAAGGKTNEARQFGETILALFEKTGHRKTSEVRQWLDALSAKSQQ